MDIKKKITTKDEAKQFCAYVYCELDLNYHPDDDFADYVKNTGEPVFDKETADILNQRIEECHEILGEEIYDICFEELMKEMY